MADISLTRQYPSLPWIAPFAVFMILLAVRAVRPRTALIAAGALVGTVALLLALAVSHAHDELGQAVKRVNEARKEGAFEAIATAEAALAKMEKKLHVAEVTLGEESKCFTSTYDSFLMKVPLSARGVLRIYAADWVRLCFPRKVGKKTVVKVLPAKQIRMEVRQLIPVKSDTEREVR